MPLLQKERAKNLLNRIKYKRFWLYSVIVLLLIVGLTAASRQFPAFAEWHARYVYPLLVQTIGRLFGVLPFSLFEVLIASVVIGVVVGSVLLIIRLVRKRGERCKTLYAAARRLVSAVLTLLLIFTLTAGINYQRAPFSDFSGLTMRPVHVDELKQLCTILRDQLVTYADEVPIAENGTSMLTCNTAQEAAAAMKKLGATYEELSGDYPRPKPIFCSIVMSYSKISGIYSPFTIEANYNRLMVPYNIPLTVCHELSHLRGFMREDEANFIAYLACIGSDHAEFRYSGAMLGFLYATNALYGTGESAYCNELYASLPEVVLSDYRANNAYWQQFETPVADVVDKANDAYLKGNAQEDGVRSYGRVVDLMIAYYIPAEK